MKKSNIKDIMLALESRKLVYSEQAYKRYLAGAARDLTEPSDQDAESQAFGNSEIAAAFECPIHTYQDAIKELRRVDFGPKSAVGEGAAVHFNGRWFVVAVATDTFVASGTNYMGISPQAPIYAAIKGKRAGEQAEFNGKTFTIDSVA